MITEVLRFNLLSPISYTPIPEADPFAYKEENGETLFCFELEEAHRQSIEPDKSRLLGQLVPAKELPTGQYLFAQKRELLCKDEILNMAVEIQQEGLWQRLKLGTKLYLRYLFEDGSIVTQLFRNLTTND